MAGLFSTFNIAKSGLFAQQKALDVTSHNIANANTDGYTRQRVQLQTTTPYSMPAMNNAMGPGQTGTGVEVSAINRVRDDFLDYQTRVELGVQGQYTGRDEFLSQIENILNEPSDTGISTLIGTFFDDWQQLSKQAETSNAKEVVAQQSLALTNELNHTYTELQKLKESTQSKIKDTVFNVNSIISQINKLNQEIVQVNVAGQQPNDLMDRRDLLLDNLSSEFGINIDKKSFDGIDVTTTNSPVDSSAPNGGTPPKDAAGNNINLIQTVDPDKGCHFSYVSAISESDTPGVYNVTYYKNGNMTSDTNKVTISVSMTQDQYKALDECRVLWADNNGTALDVNNVTTPEGTVIGTLDDSSKTYDFSNLKLMQTPTGEFKGYMSVQQDIDNYTDQMNKLAKAFAFSVNSVYSQSASFKADDAADNQYYNFFVNSSFVSTASHPSYDDTDENTITAGNITVNSALINNSSLIMTGKDDSSVVSGESDGSRALAIAQLRDKLMGIQNIDTSTTTPTTRSVFLGSNFNADLSIDPTGNLKTVSNNVDGMTLDDYFKDTVDRLGIQEQEAKRMVTNQETLLSGFQQSKDSVSGVSLDEEMANLVQFQHAYQANAKIISTVDELLDVVINGLKK